VTEIMRSNSLAWYGHVMRRNEIYTTKKDIGIKVDGHPRRGQKRWLDCVKKDNENTRNKHGNDE
jgi:hypothetical protein